MEIELEKIVSLVVEEVVRELSKQGVTVVNGSPASKPSAEEISYGVKTKSERIDMSKYKTPLLSERRLSKLHPLTGEIILKRGTVITPKAKEMIREKRISVRYE